MNTYDQISIVGCGWLGLPLGKSLVQQGFPIKGSTTRREKLEHLASAGIKPYLLSLSPGLPGDYGDFFECDTLIINLPPRNQNGQEDFHLIQLMSVKKAALAHGVKNVLFVSSTAVYPELNQPVMEADALKSCLSRGGISLLRMEHLFSTEPSFQTTVVRFGGLIGPGREPGRFLSGKTARSADAPVNLIHLDDCIGIIEHILRNAYWNEVFNACCPFHPTRREFYTKAAEVLGLNPPVFDSGTGPYKQVRPDYLLAKTGYQFKFPNPLDML